VPAERDGDVELCAAAAAGDRRAFGSLVARHERRLRAFLTHLAGADLADELAQETFIRAWRAAGQFRGQSQYASWLCSIGWRCFVDETRRRRSETRKRDAFAAVADRSQAAPAHAGVDLSRVLAALEPVERAALVLCDGHGWSHSEAAAILRIPLGTLKGVVARAKQKCRTMLTVNDDERC
jgi:RNA polymerase sigma-70 factor (ECF subfamily)